MKFAIKVNNSLYFEMIPLSDNWESVAWELDKATAGFDHFRNMCPHVHYINGRVEETRHGQLSSGALMDKPCSVEVFTPPSVLLALLQSNY